MSRLLPKSSWSILLQSSRSILQLALLILASGLSSLSAQPALQNEGSRIVTLPSGERVFEWYGKLGRAYFIQVSDPSDHLNKWKWSNVIERGNNQAISHEISSTADKAFFRLQYTDQVAADLDNADFDGDGLTNLAEITATALTPGSSHFIQSNPLDADTDHDGLGDKFERDHGLDPADDGSTDPSYGPNGDPDGDGLTNLAEQTRGTAPFKRDTDNDGVSDWDEIFQNQSDPIAAMDADNDGIPDDFEKWLSAQLLAFQPNPALWGAFSSGLLSGNLDPTHDYTGENLTALQLATKLNRLNQTDSQNSAFKIERQRRFTRLSGYSRSGPNPIGGYFYVSMPNGFVSNRITAASELNAADFLAKSEASNWEQSGSPILNSWQRFNEYYLTSQGDSFFSTTTDGDKTTYAARLVQSRFQIQATQADHESVTQQLLKVITRVSLSNNNGNVVNLEIVSADKFAVNIPQGKFFSSWHEFQPPITDGYSTNIDLLPLEAAPKVIAVNSDFDEGRIDPATNFAIPDCDDMAGVDLKTGAGNTKGELGAERNHLDGAFTTGQPVIDDLHKGWFGVNPNQLSDEFWAGANVTIRKIDKIDNATGYKESGQVRFYAKWNGNYYGIVPYDFETFQPVNLVSAGVNLRPTEGVYGASSTIPGGADFYMEGVRPGTITLEWRFKKGDVDVKHEQTFQVETRKTVAEWQEEVRYQIRLQTKVKTGTAVDVGLYDPSNGFRDSDAAKDNLPRVIAIYDYYQQLFKQMPEKFMWAGMAKVAAAPIYAGMSDLHTWWLNSALWPVYSPRGFRDPGIQIFMKGLLLGGQKNIFNDKAWAHRAYKASGIGALNHVELTNRRATNFEAWKLMDAGIIENDQSKIFEANGRLLRREQQEVVQQNYDNIQNLWIYQPPAHPNINGGVWVAVNSDGLSNAGEWLSANSNNNPLPGGPGFRTIFPSGRLDFFNDRWAWTSNAASGMLEIWTGASTSAPAYDAGRRASENGKTIKAAATNYGSSSSVHDAFETFC